jgi:hypothetical protein
LFGNDSCLVEVFMSTLRSFGEMPKIQSTASPWPEATASHPTFPVAGQDGSNKKTQEMENTFEFLKYEPSLRQEWDRVVRESKNGNFLHLRDYIEYHAHRFDECSVVVAKQGKPIAVFPCNRVSDRAFSHGGLTYGGLIYSVDTRASDVLAIFQQLAHYYKQSGIKSIRYKAIPHVFHSYPAEEDLYALFRLNAKLYRRDIACVIQMNKRLRFTRLRRSNIEKAENGGRVVKELAHFEDFHELLNQVLDKFGAKPVHSLDEMQLLHSRFPDSIRLFGAIKDERLLAGALIYDFGHVAHLQYVANSDDGRKVGALDFIIGYLIDSQFASKQYFSFGTSNEQDGQYLNEGLIFQKEGFGGRGVAHDFYEIDLSNLNESPNT